MDKTSPSDGEIMRSSRIRCTNLNLIPTTFYAFWRDIMLKRKFSNKDIDDLISIDVDCEKDETIESYKSKDEVKGLVKDVYKNIKTLYGIYDPNHTSKFVRMLLIVSIGIIFVGIPIGFIIWNTITHKFEWWIDFVILGFIAFASFFIISFLKDFLSAKFKAYVFFYKVGERTITIYKQIKNKHITIYLSKKKVFRKYKNGDWKEIIYNEDEMMGKDLLFSKLKSGFNRHLDYMERKNGEQIVYVYNKELRKRTTIMTFQDGVLKSLEHCKLYYDNEAKLRINAVDLLTVLEINTMRSCDLPKSFLEFCDSNEIEFLKENECIYFI